MQDIVPQPADVKDYFTAVMTFAGVVVTALSGAVGYAVKHYIEKRRLQAAKGTTDVELKLTFSEFATLCERVGKLISTTKVERFLILKAENGVTMPEDTTIIHSLPTSQALMLIDNVNFSIDSYYRDMLIKAEKEDRFDMETADMPAGSKLRKLFEGDGVTYANCHFMCKYPSLIDNAKWTIIYFMLTTTKQEAFTPHEHTKIGIFADWIKNLLSEELGQ
jgi:hypothetical protein